MTGGQDDIDYGHGDHDFALHVAIELEKFRAGLAWNNERELEFRKRWEEKYGGDVP